MKKVMIITVLLFALWGCDRSYSGVYNNIQKNIQFPLYHSVEISEDKIFILTSEGDVKTYKYTEKGSALIIKPDYNRKLLIEDKTVIVSDSKTIKLVTFIPDSMLKVKSGIYQSRGSDIIQIFRRR